MSVEALCEQLVEQTLGTATPGAANCFDDCAEMLALVEESSPVLAALLLEACVPPCMVAAHQASAGQGEFAQLFCSAITHSTPPSPPAPAPADCGAEGQACCDRTGAGHWCDPVQVICRQGRCEELPDFFHQGDNVTTSGQVSVCKPALEGFSFLGAKYAAHGTNEPPDNVLCVYFSESQNVELDVYATRARDDARPCGYGVAPVRAPDEVFGNWHDQSCWHPDPSRCPFTWVPKAAACPSDQPKYSGQCRGPSEALQCGPGDFSCYDGVAPVLGQCSPHARYFDGRRSCNRYCRRGS